MYQLFVLNRDRQDVCTPRCHIDGYFVPVVYKNKILRHLSDNVKNVNTTEDREGQLVYPYDEYSTGKEILHLGKFIIINLFIALEHTFLIYLYIYIYIFYKCDFFLHYNLLL